MTSSGADADDIDQQVGAARAGPAGPGRPRTENPVPSVDAGGVRVAFVAAGSGETVLLLHSSASSGAQWRSLTDRLKARWRVVAPDLQGYGRTGQRPGPAAPGLGDDAALAAAALGASVEPIHLVGHSFGGAIALRLAAERPERLLSLTLIEPVAFHLLRPAPKGAAEHALFQEVAELAAEVAQADAAGDGRRGMARFIDYWNGNGAWQRMPPERQAALALQTARVALDFRAAMTDAMRLETLWEIAVPTLVLRGTASPGPTRRIAALVAQTLPQASLRSIDGAGHMLPLTHPEAVNAAIAEHLAGSTTARRRPAA